MEVLQEVDVKDQLKSALSVRLIKKDRSNIQTRLDQIRECLNQLFKEGKKKN